MHNEFMKVTLGTLAVITNEKGEVLLVQPTYSEGKWQLPGGYVENGESPFDTIRRELLEELNINVEIKRFAGVYYKAYEHNLNIVFVCGITGGTPIPDKNEILTYDFFDIDSLPKGLSYPSSIVIRDSALQGSNSFVLAFKSPTERA
jgi:ADP-ribose pyrophosphatase YjhB (NUDIX family)